MLLSRSLLIIFAVAAAGQRKVVNHRPVRFVMIGASGVGKSTLANTFWTHVVKKHNGREETAHRSPSAKCDKPDYAKQMFKTCSGARSECTTVACCRTLTFTQTRMDVLDSGEVDHHYQVDVCDTPGFPDRDSNTLERYDAVIKAVNEENNAVVYIRNPSRLVDPVTEKQLLSPLFFNMSRVKPPFIVVLNGQIADKSHDEKEKVKNLELWRKENKEFWDNLSITPDEVLLSYNLGDVQTIIDPLLKAMDGTNKKRSKLLTVEELVNRAQESDAEENLKNHPLLQDIAG